MHAFKKLTLRQLYCSCVLYFTDDDLFITVVLSCCSIQYAILSVLVVHSFSWW